MTRIFSVALMLIGLFWLSSTYADSNRGVLNKGTLEASTLISRHNDSSYSKGSGYFVGFSVPLYVTKQDNMSLALDGGYGNIGTIEGEDKMDNPYSLRMTVLQLGLRSSILITNQTSLFAKLSAVRVDPDSTDPTEDLTYKSQLAMGFEWHLPKGLGLNLSYAELTNNVSSIMIGMTIR